MRSRIRPLLVVAVALAGVTGCSAVPDFDPPATPPPATASVPADGVTLRELGAEYGPVDAVVVPREHRLQLLTSQINVVNVVFDAPDADELAEWFRGTLPGAGWTITDDAGGTLIFTGHGWDGVFTPMGDGSPGGAFSLRKQGQ
ncbi:MAG: hypothetical protein GXX86_07950 [Propionibacterium sp.]|nr:hypothetical protein [Propionibacterium sp.]